MNSFPRTAAVALAALLSHAAPVPAQQPAQQPAPSAPARPQRASRTRPDPVDPLAETRRATAIGLITSLADEARSFRDEVLRARVQARAANALWDTEQERARALFRRAWDAAEAGDREAQRKQDEDRRRQMAEGGSVMLFGGPNLRAEVLRLAASRDRALGEEFLAKLEEARKQQEADAAAAAAAANASRKETPTPLESGANPFEQRLSLARQLLQSGDVERARQFAEPALQQPSSAALRFLVDFRTRAPEEADKIYAALVARAATDASSDANTVSLLSSYLFTPHMFINIDRGGGYGISTDTPRPAPSDVAAPVTRAFFQMAAAVLLRPLPPADQDRSSAGRSGTYFMIARLLPLFEQHLPAAVPELRTRLTALLPDLPARFRESTDQLVSSGLAHDDSASRDNVQAALDRAAAAQTPRERDGAYIDAAFAASAKNDPRARGFAEKIEDKDARAQLLAVIDYEAVGRALTQKDAEEAVRLAERGELTRLQRVWAFTEAAKLLAKDDRGRALELLDMAAAESRRIDAESADRARATLAVLTPLFDLDPGRVWSLVPELVKSVNATPDFSGEDGRMVVRFRTRERASVRSTNVDAFNLQPVFAALARSDLNRAVDLARSFTAEGPRAVATLAVASAVLEDKSKPRPRT